MRGLGSPPLHFFFHTFLFRFILKKIFKHQKFIHETFYILIFTIKSNLTLYKESSKPWNLQNSLKSKILIFWPKMTKYQTYLVRKKKFSSFFWPFFVSETFNLKKKIWEFFIFFEKFDPKWPVLARFGPFWTFLGPKNIFFDFFAPWTWKMMGHMIKLA